MIRRAAWAGFWSATVTGEKQTRAERHEGAKGSPPDLPALHSGAYLEAAWREIGMASIGFGLEPLRWSEIDAYARMTGEIEHAWEARVLRDMSIAYVRWRKLGEDALCMTPDEVSG